MFAVVYIPGFCLQAALRHNPELANRPVALIDESLPKPVIVQLTKAARLSGVREGLTSTQAMARCREILIKSKSSAQEAAAADTLLQCGYLFSPYVEDTAPGICTLDLKNQSNAGDEKFGQQVIALLEQFNLKAQIGVAPTPAVALHAARRATPFLRVDDPANFLNELPVESLDPTAALLSILDKWGIRTIGAFLALGKDALAERLGVEALELFRGASTTNGRPLKLTNAPEIFEETFEFENEIESLEPLLFILRRFIEQITLRLTVSSFAAEEIFLRLTLCNQDKYERLFKIPAPTTNVDVLFRVLYTHLETVTTEHPIKGLYLRARPCRPGSEQFSLFDSALRDPNHFYETLGRLTALLGPDRAGTPIVQSTWRPDAFQMQPVDFSSAESAIHESADKSRDMTRIKRKLRSDMSIEAGLSPRSSFSPLNGKGAGVRGTTVHEPHLTSRPGLTLRRFRPPLPAQVELHDKRPNSVRSSLFHGRLRDAIGPWRSSGQWWDKQKWQRDEWDVHSANGRLYRIYCEQNNWFVEGIYD